MTITFEGDNKIINISETNYIDAKTIYSEWKKWSQIDNNSKYTKAFKTIGGEPTISGQYSPSYFFLLSGWKIKIENLSILIEGNLYSEDGSSPFININSNIIQKTSDANTVATSGSNITPADIWNYDTRTLTTSGTLTQEEHDKLMDTLTKKEFLSLKDI